MAKRPPKDPTRNPAEFFLVGFVLVANLPAALDLTELPPSVAAQSDAASGRLWLTGLVLGCIIAAVGMLWPRHADRIPVNGYLLEQIGMMVLGVTSAYYAVALLLHNGDNGNAVAGYVAGFGAFAFFQAGLIQRFLRHGVR